MFCLIGFTLACTAQNSHFVTTEDFSQPPIERYKKIWEVSPFVVVTDLSGQEENTGGRFVITGFFRAGGKDVVFLFDRTTLERIALSPGETKNGITLSAVQHNGTIEGLRASVSTGGMPVEIVYDPKAVPNAMANISGQPQPPSMPPSTNPQPPPHLQQPGNPNTVRIQPGQSPHNQPPPRRVIRRRAIVAPQ